jgi:chromosome segregation ATPase
VLTAGLAEQESPYAKLDELQAEIEELRTNRDEVHRWNKGQAEPIRTLDAIVKRQDDEVERLRGTLEWQRDNDGKNAETIARLLKELENGRLAFSLEREFAEKQTAEVERLKESLADADRDVAILMPQVERLKADNALAVSELMEYARLLAAGGDHKEAERIKAREDEQAQEIQRLRTELMYAQADVKLLEAEVKQYALVFGEIVTEDDE